MTDTGILLIVAIVLLSRWIGYSWKSERKNLEFAFYAFVAALAVSAIGAFAEKRGFTRFIVFASAAAQAGGAFFLVRAAFGLGGQLAGDDAKDA